VTKHHWLGRRRLSPLLALLLAGIALSGPSSTTGASAAAPPRVSVISDSILTAVTWSNDAAQAALSQGLDLQIDAAVGRRLNGQSLEFQGGYATTTLSVINSWATTLGSTVVIVDGYNDLPENFAGDVELTLDTLRNDGVQHVLWVNLHEVRPEYAAKNAVLAAAAKSHPELRVLDWNTYAAGHPDWFQTDGIHLVPSGGLAIATWIHQAIEDALAPPAPAAPASDPTMVVDLHQRMVTRAGLHFARRLYAAGGTAPLHWHVTGLSLRHHRLHLLAGGELRGTPTRTGTFRLPLQVTDAGGSTKTVTVVLVIRPSRP
jgi:hypothetical protein